MKKFLLQGAIPSPDSVNFTTLLLRLAAGSMMLTHGLTKLSAFSVMYGSFPPMLGLSGKLAFTLLVGAEAGCSMLIIVGLFTRLAALPLVFSMGVAAFVAHSADPFAAKELALFYMVVFVVIFFLGGGKYSLDHIVFSRKKA